MKWSTIKTLRNAWMKLRTSPLQQVPRCKNEIHLHPHFTPRIFQDSVCVHVSDFINRCRKPTISSDCFVFVAIRLCPFYWLLASNISNNAEKMRKPIAWTSISIVRLSDNFAHRIHSFFWSKIPIEMPQGSMRVYVKFTVTNWPTGCALQREFNAKCGVNM